MKNILFLLAILIIAGSLRLWQLGKVPVSMSDDEVRLTYSAYSIWETGKDLKGNILPLSFILDDYAFNPVPIYVTSFFVGLLGLNMFVARLPFALVGILSVVLVYLIAIHLFKKRSLAILSALIFSFSVWHLQISRFAYEGGLSLFFNLLGIFLFLLIKKDKMIPLVLAMLALLAAFYSYSGTKLIFLPIVVILVWYRRQELSSKQTAIAGFFVFLTLTSFLFLSKTQNAASYGGRQFFFQDIESAAKAVELERRGSSSPEFLKRIYHNKLTYWSKIFTDHYLYAFSPQYLLLSQEASGIFSLWFRGQMYYPEAILLPLGILYLFQKNRRELLLLTLFLIIAPLPSGLGPEPITYTIRSNFMLLPLVIFTGAGAYSLFHFLKSRKMKLGIYAFLLMTYLYLVGGYLNQYYFEWSKYSAKYYNIADKDLASWVAKEKGQKNQIIIDGVTPMFFLHYAFYNQLSPSLVQELYRQKPIEFDNIIFRETCLDISKDNPRAKISPNSTYIFKAQCLESQRKTGIDLEPNLILKSHDSASEWLIFDRRLAD